ncbi:hypothetical protein AKJ16_DCAP25276 [Drosera capensis]
MNYLANAGNEHAEPCTGGRDQRAAVSGTGGNILHNLLIVESPLEDGMSPAPGAFYAGEYLHHDLVDRRRQQCAAAFETTKVCFVRGGFRGLPGQDEKVAAALPGTAGHPFVLSMKALEWSGLCKSNACFMAIIRLDDCKSLVISLQQCLFCINNRRVQLYIYLMHGLPENAETFCLLVWCCCHKNRSKLEERRSLYH